MDQFFSLRLSHDITQFLCFYVRYGRFVYVRFRASLWASGEVQSASACDSSAFVVTFSSGWPKGGYRTDVREAKRGGKIARNSLH